LRMNTYHINPSTDVTVRIAILTIASILALQLIGCSAKPDPTSTMPQNTTTSDSTTLGAKHIAQSDEPNVNSNAIEAVWQQASPFTVLANPTNPATGSTIPVTIKSVYSDGNVYMLAQYDDAVANMLNQPLKFTGGDFLKNTNWVIDQNNYEDGFSFMFEMTPCASGAKTFQANGCTMACHTSNTDKWAKGMFPENDGTFDIWYWRASTSNATGLAEDNVSIGSPVFATDYDEPNDQVVGYNVDNSPAYLPFNVAGGDNGGLDNHFYISQPTETAFGVTTNPVTGANWAAGDLVPTSIIQTINPIGSSDFWDVKARGYWANGKWTIKFKRALTTASVAKDVQFAAGGSYPFAFAIHNNNAPADHYGVTTRALKLSLMK
jgi:hypothetical protein